MTTMQGHVSDITREVLGDELAAAAALGATVLQVLDVADFDEDGGQLRINGEIHDYSAIDDDDATITLTTGLVAAAAAETRVDVWDPLTGDVVSEWIADVVDDATGDQVQAVVEHTLADRLATAVRGETGESVVCAEDDGVWTLTSVLGKTPAIDARSIETRADYPDEVAGGVKTTLQQPLFFLSSGTLDDYGTTSITPSSRVGELRPRIRLQSGLTAPGGPEPSLELAARYIMISDPLSDIERIEMLPSTGDLTATGSVSAGDALRADVILSLLGVRILLGDTATPFRASGSEKSGSATVNIVSTGTPASAAVNFAVAFPATADVPNIQLTVSSTNPQNWAVGHSSVSRSGFTLTATRLAGAAASVNVHWAAKAPAS